LIQILLFLGLRGLLLSGRVVEKVLKVGEGQILPDLPVWYDVIEPGDLLET